MTHTDIERESAIIRYMPPVLRPYALLARLDRPIGVWLLLLPGWWGITLAGKVEKLQGRDIETMALFAAGAVVMRAAGCTVNDLWDRHLDRAVERTAGRPLAAGTVTVRSAMIFAALLALTGLWILTRLPLATIMLGVMALPLIILYPLAKRVIWWPQAILGLTFNFGAMMGWAAVTGSVAKPALILYLAGIFWTLGYDTIYAFQDVRDDVATGIKSTARRFGRAGPYWITLFYTSCLALILLAFVRAGAGPFSCAMLVLPAWHVVRQLRDWRPDDPTSCLAIFRANRDFGLLVLLAAAL